jgi:VanZ family protein
MKGLMNASESSPHQGQTEWNVWSRMGDVLFVLAVAGSFVGTHLPPDDIPHLGSADKLAHLLAYGVIGFLAAARLAVRGQWTIRSAGLWFVLLWVWAGFDELTQPLVNRSAEWGDWLADGLGLTIGMLLATLLLPIWTRLQPARTKVKPG